ncbi:MAG: vWA domain-containing protein [Planctomycetota bacterium]
MKKAYKKSFKEFWRGLILSFFLLSCSTDSSVLDDRKTSEVPFFEGLPTFPKESLPSTGTLLSSNDSIQLFYDFGVLKPNQEEFQFCLKGGSALPHPRLPMDLLFLVDISGSMASENKLTRVKEALFSLLDYLHPQDRIAIVLFDEVPEIWLLFTPISEKENIREYFHPIYPRGGSNVTLALEKCYRIFETQQQQQHQQHLILITDGPDTPDRLLLKMIEENFNKKHIMLSVLGLGENASTTFLIEMAKQGRGFFFSVSESAHLLSCIKELLTHFSNIIASHIEIDIFFEDLPSKTQILEVSSSYPLFLEYPEYHLRPRDLSVQDILSVSFSFKRLLVSTPQNFCRITLKYQDGIQQKKIQQIYTVPSVALSPK